MTSLRWRRWSGGSIWRIETAPSAPSFATGSPAWASAIWNIWMPYAEEKTVGLRETARISAWRVRHQNRPDSYQCTGSVARRRAKAASGSCS